MPVFSCNGSLWSLGNVGMPFSHYRSGHTCGTSLLKAPVLIRSGIIFVVCSIQLATLHVSACFQLIMSTVPTCRMPTRLMNLAQELLFLYWDVWWRNLFLKGIKRSPSTSLAAFFSLSLPSPCNYFSALISVGWHTLWYVTLSCDKEYSPRLFHDEACLQSHCILLEFQRP